MHPCLVNLYFLNNQNHKPAIIVGKLYCNLTFKFKFLFYPKLTVEYPSVQRLKWRNKLELQTEKRKLNQIVQKPKYLD